MLTLLTNANLYSPRHEGIKHLLLGGGKILGIYDVMPDVGGLVTVETVDMDGMVVAPGFIDAHVHSTGGGGEDGFSTQAPQVPLTRFTRYGVTSVVGLLGTDDETRSTANLLARTRALREEGLSAWCWTGGYHVPPTTLTGSVRTDITHIDCVLGLGELAISDHRSSQPTIDELARLASEVHVAGLLTRKAGVLHLHLGDGERGLELVRRLLDETELPARMFHPTHCNRRPELFAEACELSHRGITVDITADTGDGTGLSSAAAWEQFQADNCPPDKITLSSDSGGCLPVFDEQGEMQKMDFATSKGLLDTLVELMGRGHELQDVLPCLTSNVATLLRLKQKGSIEAGRDADLLCLDDQYRPRHVLANGRWMIREYQPAQYGTFEEQ